MGRVRLSAINPEPGVRGQSPCAIVVAAIAAAVAAACGGDDVAVAPPDAGTDSTAPSDATAVD